MGNYLWLEILVIALVIIFFASLLIIHFYKKAHGIPTGECACCKNRKNDLVKQYHQKYSKK